MRSFIALAVMLAALNTHAALAQNGTESGAANQVPPFAEDGVYIAPGDTVEVAIAGRCRQLTNQDKRIGFFFSPDQPDSWPSGSGDKREPLEPVVTEAPCR